MIVIRATRETCFRPEPLAPEPACLLSVGFLRDLKNLAHPGTSKKQLVLRAASAILPSSFSGADWQSRPVVPVRA
jgi:hypothetical protein